VVQWRRYQINAATIRRLRKALTDAYRDRVLEALDGLGLPS